MFKTFWSNWIEGKATEKQVTDFYDKFSNVFELIKEFQNWNLSRHEDRIDTPAELILKRRGSPWAYESLVCDFIKYKKCADCVIQYLIRNPKERERCNTLIFDRGKVYRVTAYLLETFENIDAYVDDLSKEDFLIVGKRSHWCKA